MKKTLTQLSVLTLLFLMSFSTIAETTVKIRLQRHQKKKSAFYHIVASDSRAPRGKLQNGTTIIKASIIPLDKESPVPLTKSFEMDIIKDGNIEGVFAEAKFDCKKKNCLFNKKDDPIGKSYKVTLSYLDKNGKEIKKESFQSKVELEPKPCKTKVKINTITIEGFNYISPNSKQNSEEIAFFTKIKGSKYHLCIENELYSGAINSPSIPRNIYLNAQTAIEDLRTINGKTTIYNIQAIYNAKTNRFEAEFPDIDSIYIKSIIITPVICGESGTIFSARLSKVLSVQNGAISFATKKVKDKDNKEDDDSTNSCNGNYQIQDGFSAKVDNNDGFSIVAVLDVTYSNPSSQKISNEKPLTIEAIVELTDCNGKTVFIGIPLRYNEKTKSYSSSQALPKCGTGEYTLKDISFKGKDGCGNGYVWIRNWRYN